MESSEAGPHQSVEIDEAQIIASILKGDSHKFEVLYTKYERQIFSYVYSMLNYHPQDTEDVCSTVWIKAYNKLDRFNRKKKFFSWIYTIARNCCFDHLRKKRITELSLDDVSEFRYASVQIEDVIIKRDVVLSALNRLSLKDKNLLIMRYIEGYMPKDIAEILGIPVNRVSVQLNRALAQAKKQLQL